MIFINDLPYKIKSSVRLFADDYVLYRNIHSLQDCLILQEDLDSLGGPVANEVQCCQMSLYESDSALLTQSFMTTLCSSKLWKTLSPLNILV